MHPLAPQVTQILQTYLDKAATLYGKTFAMPEVQYNLAGQVAGFAHYNRNLIRLNTHLLNTHPDHLLNQTVPHELAHLITWQLFGGKLCKRHGKGFKVSHHGPEWQSVMRRFGLRPDRCHTLPTVAARKIKIFRYVCSCRKHDLSALRHKRIQAGKKFICKSCRKSLVFLNEIL